MDELDKRVLEVFDEGGSEALLLSTLAERVAGPAAGGGNAVRSAVARLLDQGWLRPSGAPNVFERTEDGRLAVAGPRDVTLYTRPGCHLCEETKARMAPLLRRFGASLREVNIDADTCLRERYTNDVPVIFLGPRKVAKHRLDLEQFRRRLERSAR